MQSVFVTLANRKLDALVHPEALECVHAVQGHRVFGTDLWICGDNLGVALKALLVKSLQKT